MTQENNHLLQEIHRAASMGEHATTILLPKVQNRQLKAKMEQQTDAYQRITEKSSRMLYESHQLPRQTGTMAKFGLWTAIQKNTLFDQSSSHIAELMIQGSSMAITDLTKTMNHLQEADAGAKELAEEYLACETKHVESMKQYL